MLGAAGAQAVFIGMAQGGDTLLGYKCFFADGADAALGEAFGFAKGFLAGNGNRGVAQGGDGLAGGNGFSAAGAEGGIGEAGRFTGGGLSWDGLQVMSQGGGGFTMGCEAAEGAGFPGGARRCAGSIRELGCDGLGILPDGKIIQRAADGIAGIADITDDKISAGGPVGFCVLACFDTFYIVNVMIHKRPDLLSVDQEPEHISAVRVNAVFDTEGVPFFVGEGIGADTVMISGLSFDAAVFRGSRKCLSHKEILRFAQKIIVAYEELFLRSYVKGFAAFVSEFHDPGVFMPQTDGFFQLVVKTVTGGDRMIRKGIFCKSFPGTGSQPVSGVLPTIISAFMGTEEGKSHIKIYCGVPIKAFEAQQRPKNVENGAQGTVEFIHSGGKTLIEVEPVKKGNADVIQTRILRIPIQPETAFRAADYQEHCVIVSVQRQVDIVGAQHVFYDVIFIVCGGIIMDFPYTVGFFVSVPVYGKEHQRIIIPVVMERLQRIGNGIDHGFPEQGGAEGAGGQCVGGAQVKCFVFSVEGMVQQLFNGIISGVGLDNGCGKGIVLSGDQIEKPIMGDGLNRCDGQSGQQTAKG